jgi:hypothetical protein
MKNIHILATNQPSKLHLIEDKLLLTKKCCIGVCDSEVHIYITNDEEIKEGDWVYDETSEELIYQVNTLPIPEQYPWKKIVLSTDPTLIADGVQAIDDEFLEWLCEKS